MSRLRVAAAAASLSVVAGLAAVPASVSAAPSPAAPTASVSTAAPAAVSAAKADGADLRVRLGAADSGDKLNVLVRTSRAQAGETVSLSLMRRGGAKTVASGKVNAKGKVRFTVPGRFVTEKGRLFVLSGDGFNSTTFRSVAAPARLGAVPAAPINVAVDPGDGAAYVSWLPQDDATGYRVSVTAPDGSEVLTDWSTSTLVTLPSLTNDSLYVVAVQARNVDGEGSWSSDNRVRPTADAPGALPSLAALPGDEVVVLTWLPAERAEDYVVLYREKGAAEFTEMVTNVTAGADYHTATVWGLTNGQQYEFQVFGGNVYGRGAPGVTVAAPVAGGPDGDVNLADAPGPARGLTLRPFSERIYAYWNAPTTGTPEFYNVSYSTDLVNWVDAGTQVGTDRNADLKNLTNGQNYYVQVIALNGSDPSEPIVTGPAMPIAKPSRTLNARGNPTNGGIYLEWASSSEAQKYQVRYRPETSATWAPPLYVDAPATGYFLENLMDEVPYFVTVAAWNTSGAGPAVSIGPLTPSDNVPAAVTNLQAAAGNAKVTLTWDAVAGATGYRVNKKMVTTGETVASTVVSGDFTTAADTVTYTVPGLVNGQSYVFTVVATNQYGYSLLTSSEPVTPKEQADLELSYSNTNFTPGSNRQVLSPTVTGAIGPVNFTLNGTLPTGVTFDQATGQFIGPAASAWNFDAFTMVSAGNSHTCAVLTDGTAKCWGNNSVGQLGDGTTTSSLVPVTVKGLTGAIWIAAGTTHTCAVLSDGTTKCWGDNSVGQLGDGTMTSSLVPVTVLGLSGASQITAGWYTSCALLKDGTAKCWGFNGRGQLGNGTTSDSLVPVAVTGLTGATQIAGGTDHTCVVLDDGTAKCWGENHDGDLGNGTTENSSIPVAVTGLTGATQIAAGDIHSCAVLADGTAKCWGSGGLLGAGEKQRSSAIPVTVKNLTGAVQIGAGSRHTCAVLTDGTAKCWGVNTYGQIGDGTAVNDAVYVPVSVVGLTGARQVSGGWGQTCAVLTDGTAKCWGYNGTGQLGNGTTENSSIPVTVTDTAQGFPAYVTVTATDGQRTVETAVELTAMP